MMTKEHGFSTKSGFKKIVLTQNTVLVLNLDSHIYCLHQTFLYDTSVHVLCWAGQGTWGGVNVRLFILALIVMHVLHSTVMYWVLLYNTVLKCTLLLHYIVLIPFEVYCTVLHFTTLYCTVRHFIAVYFTIQYTLYI